MPLSEAARADLYNGLADVLGPERAETLMTQLPRFDTSEVATRSDLRELRAELKGDMAAIHTRLDRMFLALVAGLFAIVAAMLGVLVTSL